MSNRVIILRGLPGSGKSTLAKDLSRCIVSADDYFHLEPNDGLPRLELRGSERPGPYQFNPAELPYAHGRCLRIFLELLREETWPVVVDNTNTTAVEMAPYVALAQAFGASVEIVRVVAPVSVCMARQTHGVPEAAVHAMARRLDDPLPPWWPAQRVEVTG